MCSNPIESNRPGAAASSGRVWSITQRLTWLYVASTAALLLLAGGYLFWTLQRSVYHTRHALIASKVEVLRGLLRELPEKAEALASEIEHEASESQPLKYYLRVLDARNVTLLETPGMSALASPTNFPPPVEIAADLRRSVDDTLRHRGALLLLAAQAVAGPAPGEPRVIQIAMDTSTGNALLTDYAHRLLLVLGVGLVFAAMAGAWVARRGMRPLAEITLAARRVTASQLHERIAAQPWPAELTELAGAFDAMLDRLEDSFTRLSQFSADLAHALRTPLHNLRGEAEVALARTRSPEEYQHVLASSLEECERLARMIDGLLFLARADDPKTALKRVRLDARQEIEAVREFYDALASEQEVTVSCEGQASLEGDAMLFRRAVSNLLGNALRHTPAGGKIQIALRSLDDQGVEVTVRDNGCGIAPEHLPKIFDRFYRAGETRSPIPGGIGLGLAIIQSIMRLHGGTAHVETVVGQGTTVTLTFPALPAPAVAA